MPIKIHLLKSPMLEGFLLMVVFFQSGVFSLPNLTKYWICIPANNVNISLKGNTTQIGMYLPNILLLLIWSVIIVRKNIKIFSLTKSIVAMKNLDMYSCQQCEYQSQKGNTQESQQNLNKQACTMQYLLLTHE